MSLIILSHAGAFSGCLGGVWSHSHWLHAGKLRLHQRSNPNPLLLHLGTQNIDAYLSLYHHSAGAWNALDYQNAELDSLIEQVAAERDMQQRIEMYARIQQIISEDGVWIIPYFRPIFIANRKTVQGIEIILPSFINFTTIWLEPEG